MPLPNLTRRAPQILKRPKEPTVGDLLSGGHEPPLSAERAAGYGVLAELARREAAEVAAFAEASARNAAAEKAADDQRWEQHRRSMAPVQPLGRGDQR